MIQERLLNDHQIVYDITNFKEESDMEVICEMLATYYSLAIKDRILGPGATIWEIILSGFEFSLVNNSWGNFLKPKSERARSFMEKEWAVMQRIFFG